MAKTGEASILAVADVSKFAAQLQKDLNAAIAGITLNADSLGRQISSGVREGVDQANTELRRLGDQSGQVTNLITNQSSQAGRSMAAAFSRVGSSLSNVGEQMSMYVSLPLVAAGGLTARAAGNFEQMMYRVMAATEATGPAFEKLRQQAIDLGATTAYSATEAAQAMQILATAGFSTVQTMDAVPAVLNMAAAGAVDLATAAEIGSDILNGFGFQARDLSRVNDVLARTFMETATSLVDLGGSFKYVGPIAKGAGLTFEEVSSAIGLMGNAGIKGEMAGTALRGAMVRLMSPTKDVTDVLSKLGVKVTDSNGKLLPLVDTIRQLERRGATTADMMKLFGQEAGPGMMALISQGSGALADLTTQLRNSGGTADKVAKTQMQGLNAKLDELSGAVETLMIAIGDAGLLSVLTRAAARSAELVASMSKMSPVLLNVVAVVGAALAAAGPVLLIVGKITEAIGFLMPYVKKLGGAFKSFGAAAMAFFATPAGWVVLAIAAIVAAMVIAYRYSDSFRATMQRAFRAVGDAGRWLWETALRPAFAAVMTGLRVLWQVAQQLWAVMVPVFAAIGRTVMSTWSGQVWPMLQSWGRGFLVAGAMVRTFWTSYVVPAFSAVVAWCQVLGRAIGAWWTANGASVFASARTVIGQVGGMFSTVWSGVMAVLRSVGQVISWVFMNVTVPSARAVIAIVKTLVSVVARMRPVWMALGAVVYGAVIAVVAVVKVLWSVFVAAFNGIAGVVSWLWGSVVKPVFAGIGAAIQGAVAVIGWLWGVVQPVVMFLANAMGAVGRAMIWLWTSVFVPAWNSIGAVWNAAGAALSAVWTSVIMPVFNALKVAVGAVVGVFVWLWDTFSPLFAAIGNLIWTVWSSYISIVFDLFKLAFTNLWAAVQIWWAGFQVVLGAVGAVFMWLWNTVVSPVMSAIGAVFMWVWNTVISPVVSAIGAVFNWLWGVLQPVMSAVGAMFMWVWSNVISFVINWISTGMTWLWGVIVAVWNGIVSAVTNQISMLKQAVAGVTEFVNSISSNFQSLVNSVRDKISAAIAFVRGLPGQIIAAVGNLGTLLYEAGQNVINGLINGISSRLGALKDKIGSAAQTIRDHLPFSPAKIGPLSGSGDPTRSGSKIVSMVAEGMDQQISQLRLSAYDLGALVSGAISSPTVGGVTPVAPALSMLTTTTLPTPVMATAGAPAVTYEITVNTLDARTAGEAVVEAIKGYERRNGKGWRS